jgi:hypothetical protein
LSRGEPGRDAAQTFGDGFQLALARTGADPRGGVPEQPFEADAEQRETGGEQDDGDQSPILQFQQENGAGLPELARQIREGGGEGLEMLPDQGEACGGEGGKCRLWFRRGGLGRTARRALLIHPGTDGGIVEKVDKLVDLGRDAAFDAAGRWGLLGGNGAGGGCQQERQREENHRVQRVGVALH